MTSSASQLSLASAAVSSIASSSTFAPIYTTSIIVRLDRTNFLLWKTQVVPNISGQGYFGFLDGSCAAPPKTITTGTGDDAVTTTNPDYTTWWQTDHRVLGTLLGNMTEEVLGQMIGRNTSAAVWATLNAMFAA